MDDDERTLARFRRRMSAIEAELPEPPMPGPASATPASLRRRSQSPRRDPPGRQVYLALAVVLGLLATAAVPYLGRFDGPAGQPGDVPVVPGATGVPGVRGSAPPPSFAAPTAGPSAPTGQAEVVPVPVTVGPCPLVPYIYEGPQLWELWATHDWALIEGRLRPGGEGELSVLVTGGPFAGPVREVSWPHGYRVSSDGQGLVLERPDGSVAARQGDLVMVGGNPMGGDTFAACGIRVVNAGAAR